MASSYTVRIVLKSGAILGWVPKTWSGSSNIHNVPVRFATKNAAIAAAKGFRKYYGRDMEPGTRFEVISQTISIVERY